MILEKGYCPAMADDEVAVPVMSHFYGGGATSENNWIWPSDRAGSMRRWGWYLNDEGQRIEYDETTPPRPLEPWEAAYAGEPDCRVYWGSHGCHRPRGHDGHHRCDCCECDNHPDPDPDNPNNEPSCVATHPYYGPDTNFWGEDAWIIAALRTRWRSRRFALGQAWRFGLRREWGYAWGWLIGRPKKAEGLVG